MYETIKGLIPKKIIKQNGTWLRGIFSTFYRGDTYFCPICGFKMSRFIKLKNQNLLCSKCGSLGRTRRLWSLLENDIYGKKILHFSPSKSLKTKLESVQGIQYVTTDFTGEFSAMKKLDIESIDEPDRKYDLIICYHILEHVYDDTKAMKELLRILKPGGKCLIQTPYKIGDTYENATVRTDEERLRHFGQKDHVRIYSVAGLSERLTKTGFITRVKQYTENEDNRNGYNMEEHIIFAEKPKS